MTDDEDIDGLAAEYVLGTLDRAERRDVDARRVGDQRLASAIDGWERYLGPLGLGAPGVQPPADMLSRINKQIQRAGGGAVIAFAEAAALRRSARRWRTFAVSAGALAACLALVVAWLIQHAPNPSGRPSSMVAVLQRGSATADESTTPASPPGFVVSVNLNAGTILVSPVAVRPSSRRSYQLWVTRAGETVPSAIGIISQTEPSTLPLRGGDLTNATLAVSLEPEGGSTIGGPTGPIVFSGRLLDASP